MPTTSQGIYYPDSATSVTPLETTFATMASSINTILAGDVQIHRVANTTARNALVSQFPPSTANPLFVWRADAPSGQELEYTKNGSTWYSYSSSEDDSGPVACTAASGFSASATVRRIGKQVTLEGFAAGSFTANVTTTVITVPVGYRPSTVIGAPVSHNSGEIGFGRVQTTGIVEVRKPTTGAATVYLSATWTLP